MKQNKQEDGNFPTTIPNVNLRRQKRSWKKGDANLKRVKPCPVIMVLWLLEPEYNSSIPLELDISIANIICIAFFFFLCPGEYTGTNSDDATFTLDNAYILVKENFPLLHLLVMNWEQLLPMLSILRHKITFKRTIWFLSHAPYTNIVVLSKLWFDWFFVIGNIFGSKNIPFDGSDPLASYYFKNKQLKIKAATITKPICNTACVCVFTTGINPDELTARFVRAGGNTVPLYAHCDSDSDQIKLLGRWYYDAMMRYLHQVAQPVLQ